MNVWSVAFSPDSERIASGSFDRTVRFWHADNGKLEKSIPAHNQAVVSVAFSPDGRLLAVGGREKGAVGTLWKQLAGNRMRRRFRPTIRLWGVRGGVLQQALAEHRDDVHSLAFSPDGNWLASSSADNTVKHSIV